MWWKQRGKTTVKALRVKKKMKKKEEKRKSRKRRQGVDVKENKGMNQTNAAEMKGNRNS